MNPTARQIAFFCGLVIAAILLAQLLGCASRDCTYKAGFTCYHVGGL